MSSENLLQLKEQVKQLFNDRNMWDTIYSTKGITSPSKPIGSFQEIQNSSNISPINEEKQLDPPIELFSTSKEEVTSIQPTLAKSGIIDQLSEQSPKLLNTNNIELINENSLDLSIASLQDERINLKTNSLVLVAPSSSNTFQEKKSSETNSINSKSSSPKINSIESQETLKKNLRSQKRALALEKIRETINYFSGVYDTNDVRSNNQKFQTPTHEEIKSLNEPSQDYSSIINKDSRIQVDSIVIDNSKFNDSTLIHDNQKENDTYYEEENKLSSSFIENSQTDQEEISDISVLSSQIKLLKEKFNNKPDINNFEQDYLDKSEFSENDNFLEPFSELNVHGNYSFMNQKRKDEDQSFTIDMLKSESISQRINSSSYLTDFLPSDQTQDLTRVSLNHSSYLLL